MRNEKISDIFDYGDEIVDAIAVEYFDPAEIKELTMKKIHGETKAYTTHVRKPRRAFRTALAAAILALLLAGAAFAVYQHSMRDHALTEEPQEYAEDGSAIYQYSAAMSPAETDASAETHFIGTVDGTAVVSSDSGTPEYLAAQEWNAYRLNGDDSKYSDRVSKDSGPAQAYDVVWNAMLEELQSIADKYGLRLYQSAEGFSDFDSFYAAIGTEPFADLLASHEEFSCSAMVFDEGSFQLDAVCIPVTRDGEEQNIAISIFRDAKGTLSNTLILGEDPALYTYETYATESGVSAELALGECYSLIFAELDGCWVTVDVDGGRRENMEYLPTIDMEVLRQIADGIDFAALDIE